MYLFESPEERGTTEGKLIPDVSAPGQFAVGSASATGGVRRLT